MNNHDDHKVLYYENSLGEWQIYVLDLYERYGIKGYTISTGEVPISEHVPLLLFLKRHDICVATLSSEQLKYIPDVSTNIIKLNNLISRQAAQFKEAVREFNSDENLKTFNNTDKMDLLQRLREKADRAKEVRMYYEK